MRQSSSSVNPHAWSAAARSLLTAQALTKLNEACRSVDPSNKFPNIVDMWGNERTVNIGRFLNAVDSSGISHVSDPFTVTYEGANFVPADLYRRVKPTVGGVRDGILLVSIYQLGAHAFTPQNLVNEFCKCRAGEVILPPLLWIGQLFNGAFGTHYGEQAWKRLPNGFVQEFADLTGNAYGPHSALDWIAQEAWAPVTFAGQQFSLSWQRISQVHGPSVDSNCMQTFAFALTPARPNPPQLDAQYGYSTVELPDPATWAGANLLRVQKVLRYAGLSMNYDDIAGSLSFLPRTFLWRLCGASPKLIDLRVSKALSQHFTLRSMYSYTLKSLYEAAKKHFAASPEYKILAQLMVRDADLKNLVLNTSLHAAITMLRDSSSTMAVFSANFSDTAADYNADCRNFGNEPAPTKLNPLALGCFCLAAIYCWRKFWGGGWTTWSISVGRGSYELLLRKCFRAVRGATAFVRNLARKLFKNLFSALTPQPSIHTAILRQWTRSACMETGRILSSSCLFVRDVVTWPIVYIGREMIPTLPLVPKFYGAIVGNTEFRRELQRRVASESKDASFIAEHMLQGVYSVTDRVMHCALAFVVPFVEEALHHAFFALSPALDFVVSLAHAYHEANDGSKRPIATQIGAHLCLWAARFGGFLCSFGIHALNNSLALVFADSVWSECRRATPDVFRTLVDDRIAQAKLNLEASLEARQFLAPAGAAASLNPLHWIRWILALIKEWFGSQPPSSPTGPMFSLWYDQYHLLPWVDRPSCDEWTWKGSETFDHPIMISSETRAHSEGKQQNPDNTLSMKGASQAAIHSISEERQKRDNRNLYCPDIHDNGFWFLQIISAPGYAPARTDANLMAVVGLRLNAKPPMPASVQEDRWIGKKALLYLKSCNASDFFERAQFVRRELDQPSCPAKRRADTAIPLPRCEPIVLTEELTAEWLSHFEGDTRRKKRALKALEKLRENSFEFVEESVKSTTIMVKTNELLGQREARQPFGDAETYPKIKPRSIAVVAPEVQAIAGPFICEVTKRLAKAWPLDSPRRAQYSAVMANSQATSLPIWDLFQRWPVNRGVTAPWRVVPVSLAYAGKATGPTLSSWCSHAHQNVGIHVIVSGDDNCIVLNLGAFMLYVWLDASMFDQSQSKGPLTYQKRVGVLLGMPSRVATLLTHISTADSVGFFDSGGQIRVKRPAGCRDTGGPDTTFGNGVNMGTSCLYAADKLVWSQEFLDLVSSQSDARCQSVFDHLVNSMSNLGFKVVGGWSKDLYEMEFLKGAFLRVPTNSFSAFAWTLLPSRRFKCSKSWNDPAAIYDFRGIPRRHRRELGAVLFLMDQARQIATFPSVPIIRAFVRKCEQLSNHWLFQLYGCRPRKMVPFLEHRPDGWQQGPPTVEEHELAAFMRSRYGISSPEYLEIEELEATVPLFGFLSHPLYETVVRRDYG